MFSTVPKRPAWSLLIPVALAAVLAVGCSRSTGGSTPHPGGEVIVAACGAPAGGAVLVRERTAVLTFREFVSPAAPDSALYGAAVPHVIPGVFEAGPDPARSPVAGDIDCGCGDR